MPVFSSRKCNILSTSPWEIIEIATENREFWGSINGGLARVGNHLLSRKSRLVKDDSIWPDLDWQLGSEHYKNIQKPSI